MSLIVSLHFGLKASFSGCHLQLWNHSFSSWHEVHSLKSIFDSDPSGASLNWSLLQWSVDTVQGCLRINMSVILEFSPNGWVYIFMRVRVCTLRCSALSSWIETSCLSELLTRGWERVEWELPVTDSVCVCSRVCVCVYDTEGNREAASMGGNQPVWVCDSERGRKVCVCVRVSRSQWVCVRASIGQRSSKLPASCSAVCSQSATSPVLALTEPSWILSWTGPASRGLKGEGVGDGGHCAHSLQFHTNE